MKHLPIIFLTMLSIGCGSKQEILIGGSETMRGVIEPRLEADGRVTVDMGPPVFEPARVPFDTTGLVPREKAASAIAIMFTGLTVANTVEMGANMYISLDGATTATINPTINDVPGNLCVAPNRFLTDAGQGDFGSPTVINPLCDSGVP